MYSINFIINRVSPMGRYTIKNNGIITDDYQKRTDLLP